MSQTTKTRTFFGRLIYHIFGGKPFLQAAIDITNVVKTGLNSGLIDLVTGLIPGTVDDKLVAVLREKVPILLADELIVQAAGAPATEQEAQDLAVKLIDSFGKLSDAGKEKFCSSVAAGIFIFLKAHVDGEKVTFGEGVSAAEGFYQDWLAAQEAPTVAS